MDLLNIINSNFSLYHSNKITYKNKKEEVLIESNPFIISPSFYYLLKAFIDAVYGLCLTSLNNIEKTVSNSHKTPLLGET